MNLLFEMYPKIKEAYWIVNGLWSIFRSKTLDKEAARLKLHEWYKTVSKCTSREMKSVRDAITKMKSFRAQLRGVSDLPFFMFRLSKIFG